MYEFLRETMAEAGHELRSRAGAGLRIETKADTSLVTEADLASEKVIIRRIRRDFPDDKIYSEEAGLSSQDRRPGSHIWIIDPLDGTTNYANGYPFYCISIARGQFTEDGRIEIRTGAILDAPRNRLYYASKGEGAWVDGKPIRVASPRDFHRCFLVTGFYYAKGPDLMASIERFARVADACQSIRRDGAAALDLAMVAEGIYDAFWETGLMPWDVAAGALLVAEAGGSARNYTLAAHGHHDVEDRSIVAGAPGAVETIAGLILPGGPDKAPRVK